MQLVENGQVPAEQPVFDALQASLDELNKMRDTVASGGRCRTARGLMNRIRALAGHPVEAAPEAPAPAPVVEAPQVAAPPVAQAPSQEIVEEFSFDSID